MGDGVGTVLHMCGGERILLPVKGTCMEDDGGETEQSRDSHCSKHQRMDST